MTESRSAKNLREAIARRSRGCCEYCRHQQAFSTDPFSVEHIIPKSRDGSDALDNLAFSCQGCNNFKHTRVEALDPEDGSAYPLFHPRQDVWAEHFAWDEDRLRLLGFTHTGRATISVLQLNRPGVVNLRWALFLLGLHPPEEIEPDE